MSLFSMNTGDKCLITGIQGNDTTIKHLQNIGFISGTEVEIIKKTSFGIIIKVKGANIAIDKNLASIIQVIDF